MSAHQRAAGIRWAHWKEQQRAVMTGWAHQREQQRVEQKGWALEMGAKMAGWMVRWIVG